jgi:hypothetical protein
MREVIEDLLTHFGVCFDTDKARPKALEVKSSERFWLRQLDKSIADTCSA